MWPFSRGDGKATSALADPPEWMVEAVCRNTGWDMSEWCNVSSDLAQNGRELTDRLPLVERDGSLVQFQVLFLPLLPDFCESLSLVSWSTG